MAERQDLLLIPGLVCDAAVWQHQVRHLSDVAAITVPPVSTADTMTDMAAHVLAAAPPRFALAGFSMGGYVALEILQQAPDRVTRLALLDTSARADTAEKGVWRKQAIAACDSGDYTGVIDRMMSVLLHPERQIGPLAQFVREMAARVGAETYARRQRAIGQRRDSRELLRAASQPVRAICGRQDAMSSIADHAEIAELAPHGRFSLIEECGHMTILEQPVAATALLRDWLLDD